MSESMKDLLNRRENGHDPINREAAMAVLSVVPSEHCSPRFAVYPGKVRSHRDGDIHHIGFTRLCELYNVPPALCVDMSRPENSVGRDLSGLVALCPSYRGNYTLATPERGACPRDTDRDGDCHKCFNRPGGCSWQKAKETNE